MSANQYQQPPVEYDADEGWLVVTEWLGSDEYGSAAIVASGVSPEWAAYILPRLNGWCDTDTGFHAIPHRKCVLR